MRIVLMTSLLLVACTKKKVEKLEQKMTDGTWYVSNFNEDGDNETGHFADYTFVFKTDGTLEASKAGVVTSGTWSMTKDKSNDDSSTDYDFIISLPAVDKLDELNDDWDVLEQTDSKIDLMDVSGGNGGTDYLTFTKK
ncbi:MAG: hypothetical protein N4A41_11185 [Crocinitomicaceae bacterium]|nr:hypothetical protein [Crocinitomicaceae bacterium]